MTRDNSNRTSIYMSPQLAEEKRRWKREVGGFGFSSRLTDVVNRLQYVVCEHMPQFTRNQWGLIIDALNGYEMSDLIVGVQGVPLQITEAIFEEDLANKWEVAADPFVDRIKRLTPVEIVAVAEAASLYWCEPQDMDAFIARVQAKPCQLYEPVAD